MGSMEPTKLSFWYDKCNAELLLYGRSLLGVHGAEDVVQEAFLSLMRQHKEPENIRAWLFRTVRNAAISQMRRRHCRQKHQKLLSAVQKSWFESRPDDLIDAQTAQTVLASLPQLQREVVILRIWGQMSLKEIAQITGAPISTVHSRYQGGLDARKKEMQFKCQTKKD